MSANALQTITSTATVNFAGQSFVNASISSTRVLVTGVNTSTLSKGMLVIGTGIPAGTLIDSIVDANSFNLTVAATASSSTAILSIGANMANLASTSGLLPGMALSGPGIIPGTIISSIDSANGRVYTSQSMSGALSSTPAVANLQGSQLLPNAVTTNGSAVVKVGSTVGLSPGLLVTGTGVPAGAIVQSVQDSTTFTMTVNATTTGSANLTAALSNTASGEGIVYVAGNYTGGSPAIISGNITANGFTKFGPGNLQLSGTNFIAGNLVVQQGTLTLSSQAAETPQLTNLVLNDTASLDLGGKTLVVKLHDHRPLNERGSGHDSLCLFGFANEILPPVDETIVGDKQVGIKSNHLALEFPLESRHHRHHKDEHGDAKRDSDHGDHRDHRQKSTLWFQVAGRKEERRGQAKA
jgi:autotransporter-associated beta strand protein